MRLCRAGSAALVCTVLAAGAHVTAGGRAPAASLVLVFVGTWTVAALLTARRLTTSQLVGLLLIGQVVVHVASGPAHGGNDSRMLTAHVVGTAVSAWLLRHGEDLLWTLAERVGLRVGVVTTVRSIRPWRPANVLIAWVRSHRRLLLSHVIEGRGPPAGLA